MTPENNVLNRLLRLGASFALIVAIGLRAQGLSAQTITLVVGFPPGGGVDILARQLAEKLGPILGRTIIVDNRAGAGGNVAMEYVARAKADGNTLLMGNLGMLAVNPALYRNLTIDPAKEFSPIARLVVTPLVAVVPASLKVNSLQEFIAMARARPGELNFASGGNGGISHLAGELLKQQTAVDIQHVPYKGSAPALTDLIAGRVQLLIDATNVVQPYVQQGTLKPLAVTGNTRSPAMPNVQTASQAGVSDFVIYGWQGVLAPAHTPQKVIEQLSVAIQQALAVPELHKRLEEQGTDPAYMTPADFSSFITTERARWTQVIRTAHITVD
ncbi:MAG TPA: tripartite tricarboxylate transporter substrate binding protein [Burkholderiales bacterium]|nr:tripartite tricarboxylate transporter substrate binding protein [Burkholderiales bacterium]